VDVGLSEVGIQDLCVQSVKGSGDDDVSKSDSLSNKEGSSFQVVVQDVENLSDVSLGSRGSSRVVLDQSKNGEDPDGGRDIDLLGCKVAPLFDLSSLEGGGSIELLVVSGNISSRSSCGEDDSFRGLENGSLSDGALRFNVRVFLDGKIHSSVLGSDGDGP
jgi:hypothetical protein